MTVKAIMFGSIGTLVETSNLQRRAFNRAFKDAGLSWKWTIDTYKHLLTTSGGRDRIQNYASKRGIDVDANHLHQRKTEIFDSMMANGDISLRAGVKDVISFAAQNDIQLAFVTSTSKANVDAVFSALGDQLKRSDFAFVGNDTMVSQPKPSPDIYAKALWELGIQAQNCVAVEDTETSMQAALAAGIRCIAFLGEFATAQDFTDAALVTNNISPEHFGNP
jgi:beta-phosphoglucomutase-like phosphatase (HAD superfamily)